MRALPRRLLLALAALPAAGAAQPRAAAQVEERFDAAERAILAGRVPRTDGIALDMATLSENGNSVDVGISVASPMTEADHVSAIHILSEKNPAPRVATMFLSPRSGRAAVATRIRLATTQQIVVLAETSAGAVHRAQREVIVILGACVETG